MPPGEAVYDCLIVDYSILRRHGWPSELQRIRLELPQHLHAAPSPPWARHGSWLIRAAVAERPVGIAWMLPWVGPEPWAAIEEVAVVAAWRRRGIGSALVRESMQWMAEKGVHSVSTCPIAGSHWIEKLGFSLMAGGTFIRDISDVLPDRTLNARTPGSARPYWLWPVWARYSLPGFEWSSASGSR
jgi:GNAT superfamily N-acetyltransferase